MKVISKLEKVLFWLLILALLAAPLGLIYEISNREKQQYATPTAPDFVEMAYGTIAEAERRDLRESVSLTGVFRSETYEYIELKQNEPSKIRWDISVGDEIQTGEQIIFKSLAVELHGMQAISTLNILIFCNIYCLPPGCRKLISGCNATSLMVRHRYEFTICPLKMLKGLRPVSDYSKRVTRF